MGNELHDSGNLIKSPLTNYITDFMLNRYTVNNQNGKPENFTLQKRACCTKQATMKIGFPSTDGIKIYQNTFNIPVFEKATDDELSKKCNFNSIDFFPPSGYAKSDPKFSSGQTCSSWYNGFCNNIYNKRKNNFITSDPLSKLYGAYDDEPVADGVAYEGNPYPDCNCENSIYIKGKVTSSDVMANNITPMDQAQNFDSRCHDKVSSDAYIKSNLIKQNLQMCVNNMSIEGSMIADKNSNVSTQQSCSVKEKDDSAIDTKSIIDDNMKRSSDSKKTNDNATSTSNGSNSSGTSSGTSNSKSGNAGGAYNAGGAFSSGAQPSAQPIAQPIAQPKTEYSPSPFMSGTKEKLLKDEPIEFSKENKKEDITWGSFLNMPIVQIVIAVLVCLFLYWYISSKSSKSLKQPQLQPRLQPRLQQQYGQPQYGQPQYGQPQYGQPQYGQPQMNGIISPSYTQALR